MEIKVKKSRAVGMSTPLAPVGSLQAFLMDAWLGGGPYLPPPPAPDSLASYRLDQLRPPLLDALQTLAKERVIQGFIPLNILTCSIKVYHLSW